MSDINESVFKKLESFKIDFKISENALYFDKYLFNLLNDGIREKDYKKMYKAVESIEHGIGFKFDSEFNDVLQQAISKDENRVVDILEKISNLIDIVYILSYINYDMKLNLLKNYNIQNTSLLYELIRTCINHKRNMDIEKNYIPVVSQSIVNLSNLNDDMFRYLVKKSEYQRSFALVIGNALNSLNKESMTSYMETITIDKYSHNINNVNLIMECITIDTSDKIYEWCGNYLINSWQKLLGELSENEPILNDIVTSSYSNLILMCMCYKYNDKEKYYEELKLGIERYENEIYSWKPDVSRECTIYFVELTQIFMLKLVKDNNAFTWNGYDELHEKVKNLLHSIIFHKRHWKFQNKDKYEKLGLYEM